MLSASVFEQWASYHNSCFRGFADFLAEDPQRTAIWRKALDGYDLQELNAASFELYMLPADRKPQGYSSHMDALRPILSRQRAAYREQEHATRYARRCGLCGGYGLVSVVGINGHEFLSECGAVLKSGTVACKCGEGDKYRARKYGDGRWHGFATYDATKMEPAAVRWLREHPIPQGASHAATP